MSFLSYTIKTCNTGFPHCPYLIPLYYALLYIYIYKSQVKRPSYPTSALTSNNYSISSAWQASRINDAVAQCSAELRCSSMADPSSGHSPCHLGLGNTAVTRGCHCKRRGIITPHSALSASTHTASDRLYVFNPSFSLRRTRTCCMRGRVDIFQLLNSTPSKHKQTFPYSKWYLKQIPSQDNFRLHHNYS